MANYETLKSAIQQVVKTNGRKEITGELLQQSLLAMINSLGQNYQYAGIATPSTDPGTPDQNIFYLASTAGTYTNFGDLVVNDGEIAILKYNGTWTKELTGAATAQELSLLANKINSLLQYYQFAGVATPSTEPGTPEQNVFYIAGPGTYQNFDAAVIPDGYIGVLKYNEDWTVDTVQISDANAVKFVLQSLTNDQKAQARTNIEAASNGQVSQLEHKVDANELYSKEVINLDESSEYYITSLSGAYIPKTTGKITSNQYTSAYKIWLFHIPAGEYNAKKTENYGSASSVVAVATLDTSDDFVVGGSIKDVILDSLSEQVENVVFSEDTYLVITSRTDVLPVTVNYYAICEEVKKVTLRDAIDSLSLSVTSLKNDIYEEVPENITPNSKYYVTQINGAYIPKTTGKITSNQYTSAYKIILFSVPEGKYRARKGAHLSSGQGVVVAKFASLNDFVINGSISQSILTYNDSDTVYLTLNSDSLIAIVTIENVEQNFNWIAYFEKIEIVNSIEKTEGDVENIFKISLDIVIPDVVYAIVGTELNIYNDAVSLSIDRGLHSPLNYQIRWSCNKGTITDRCFRFTPASGDVGDIPCTCYLYDMRGVLVISKTFNIKVIAKNALAAAKKIVYFGDSLGESAATNLYDNFHDSNRFGGTIPDMLGTKGTTKHYEAVGGYRWSSYATAGSTGYRISVNGVTSMQVGAVYSDGSHNFEVYEVNITEGIGNCLLGRHFTNPGTLIMPSGTLTKVSGGGDASVPYTDAFQESVNPLWNDTTQELDINQYKQTLVSLGQLSSVSDKIDAVSFQFGINDNTLANDLNTIRGYISDLYDLFVGDNADCKFIVGLTTSSGNDVNGSGANYGATNDWKAYLKNTYIIRKFYLSLLEDFPNMRIATPNLSIDRYYGYALGTRQVSNRCTETEQYHTNYVHPGTSGYEQMADAYLACYVGVLTES